MLTYTCRVPRRRRAVSRRSLGDEVLQSKIHVFHAGRIVSEAWAGQRMRSTQQLRSAATGSGSDSHATMIPSGVRHDRRLIHRLHPRHPSFDTMLAVSKTGLAFPLRACQRPDHDASLRPTDSQDPSV